MTKPHLTLSFTVDRSPADVFAAVSDVRRWWGAGIEGATAKVGDEFTYRHADLHLSRQKLVEVVPGQRLVWKVTDANLSFVRSPGEWKGTELRFDLVPVAAGTEVQSPTWGSARSASATSSARRAGPTTWARACARCS